MVTIRDRANPLRLARGASLSRLWRTRRDSALSVPGVALMTGSLMPKSGKPRAQAIVNMQDPHRDPVLGHKEARDLAGIHQPESF